MPAPVGLLRTVTDDLIFQQELNECNNPRLLLGVELFSHAFGPCQALHPRLERLAAGAGPVTVSFFAADVDLILQSCSKKTLLFASTTDDDLHQSKWLRLLQKWQGWLEPAFAFYRGGQLMHVVEGPNLPAITRTVTLLSADPPAPPDGAPSQRQRSAAAFVVQCVWRRWVQQQRRGEEIDGVVYRGKELLWKREQLERTARQQALKARQTAAAAVIQRLWRGFAARRTVELQRKAQLRRGRHAGGRLARGTNGVNLSRSPTTVLSRAKSTLPADARRGLAVPAPAAPAPQRSRRLSVSGSPPASPEAPRDTVRAGRAGVSFAPQASEELPGE